MQLIIPKTITEKDDIDSKFIYNYLPYYIRSIGLKIVDKRKLQVIDNEFQINSYNIIEVALKNIRVSETSSDYLLKVDKNVTFNGDNLELLLNIITYGNRTAQGYPVIYDIFNFVAEHFESIYEEWNR